MAIDPADLIDCVSRMDDGQRARLCELLDPIAPGDTGPPPGSAFMKLFDLGDVGRPAPAALPDSGPLPGAWAATEAREPERSVLIRPVDSEVGLLVAEAQPGGSGRQRTLTLRDVIAPKAVFRAFLERYGDVTRAAGNHLRFYAPGTPDGAELKHCVLSSVGAMVEAGDMLHAAAMTLIYTESLPIVPGPAARAIPIKELFDAVYVDHDPTMGLDAETRKEILRNGWAEPIVAPPLIHADVASEPGHAIPFETLPVAAYIEGPPPPDDPPPPEFLEAVKWFNGPLDRETIAAMWRGWREAAQASPPPADALLKVADWVRGWSDGEPADPAPPLTAFAKVGEWIKGHTGTGRLPAMLGSGLPAPLGLMPVTRQPAKSTTLVEVSEEERARRAREHDHNVAEGNARQTRWTRAEARWRAAFPGEEGIPMAVAAVDLGVAIDVALNQIDAMLYDKEHKGIDPARCGCGCGMVIGCGGTRKVVVDTPDGPEFRDGPEPTVYLREPKYHAVFDRVTTPAVSKAGPDEGVIAHYRDRWDKAHERWRAAFGGEKIPMNTMALPAAHELGRVELMLRDKEELGVDPGRCPCGCGHVIGCRVP
jgi:hypothetical protein